MKRFITLSVLVFLSINGFSQIGLDKTFGAASSIQGSVRTDIQNMDTANALIVQNDGKIVVAGNSNDNTVSLVRYKTDGTLDGNFGNNGIVNSVNGIYCNIKSIAKQRSNNKILIGGCVKDASNKFDILIERYNEDGTLDNTFGSNGKIIADFGGNEKISSIALDSLDRIIIIGEIDSKILVAKYDSLGLINNFGSNGSLVIDINGTTKEKAYDLGIRYSDQAIFIAGKAGDIDSDVLLLGINSNGLPINTFGQSGIVQINVHTEDAGYDIQLGNQGEIFVGGKTNGVDDHNFIVLKFLSNGTIDNSFGANGIVETNLSNGSDDIVYSLGLQKDGKIIASGISLKSGVVSYGLARYNNNGILDSGFGSGGVYTVTLEKSIFTTTSMKMFQNRIYLAGSIDNDFSVVALSNNELALPVHLLSFYATGLQEKVVLGWTTQNEENISNYIIERSVDGKAFKPIGYVFSVPGKTSSSYSFTDDKPSTGAAQYRLKILSHDGAESFSKVILVRSLQNTSSTAYPNPVHSTLQVVLKSNPAKELAIFNASGHILKRIPVPTSTGNTIIPVDVNAIPTGTYFIRAGKETISFRKI